MYLLLIGLAIQAVSGVPGLFLARTSSIGQRLATVLIVMGSALGMTGALRAFFTGSCSEIVRSWSIPEGQFRVAIDGISLFFLVPLFLVSGLGSIYGLSYWKQADHPENGRKLNLFYGLLTGGMVLTVIARDGILFLMAWEVMALAAFVLVTTEDHEESVCEAGWIYLVATHVATLCLVAMFALLRSATGSYSLAPVHDGILTPGLATAIFLLALVGFGLKAGLMPLHVWLPSAHASAPSHVSALMSGIMIKMGIYGLVRICSFVPNPPVWWGALLLILGAVSGVLGIAFAIGQSDLKRLLAYSSIENIGIIVMGIGLALVGRSLGRADWVMLGLCAALLHVWNHSVYKSLLFLGAGSVIHATGTRQIDLLGGLARTMPRTAFCFLIGAIAICGLPPLNGFVSEFLLYIGLLSTLGIGEGRSWVGAAFAAPALALIGTLSVACFVKVFGVVFLGNGRSEHAAHAHEPGNAMLGPMVVFVALCFLIGLAPALAGLVLERVAPSWAPEIAAVPVLNSLAPLPWLSLTGAILLVLFLLAAYFLRTRLRRGTVEWAITWNCGYAAGSPSIQYTSSSFAQMLVGLFAWVLAPRMQEPHIEALFPRQVQFRSEVPDTVLDRAVLPSFRFLAWLSSCLRFMQQGYIQMYLLYIIATLIALLVWR